MSEQLTPTDKQFFNQFSINGWSNFEIFGGILYAHNPEKSTTNKITPPNSVAMCLINQLAAALEQKTRECEEWKRQVPANGEYLMAIEKECLEAQQNRDQLKQTAFDLKFRLRTAMAALHECFRQTGAEAGDLNDFEALVDRENHVIRAVTEMRGDLDKAQEDSLRLDCLLNGHQKVSEKVGWDGTQGEVRVMQATYASEDGRFIGYSRIVSRQSIDDALKK